MQPNPLIAFLQELFLRVSAKSPKFFVIWQWVSGAVVALTGIPGFLSMFNIVLPHPYDIFANKIVAAAGTGVFFMSLMPAQGKTIVKDSNGTPLKQTNEQKLPFTAQIEKK